MVYILFFFFLRGSSSSSCSDVESGTQQSQDLLNCLMLAWVNHAVLPWFASPRQWAQGSYLFASWDLGLGA